MPDMRVIPEDDPMWITSYNAFLQEKASDPLFLNYRRKIDRLRETLLDRAQSEYDLEELKQLLENVIRCALIYSMINNSISKTIPVMLARGVQLNRWSLEDAIAAAKASVPDTLQRAWHFMALFEVEHTEEQHISLEEDVLEVILPYDDLDDARYVWDILHSKITGTRREEHKLYVDTFAHYPNRTLYMCLSMLDNPEQAFDPDFVARYFISTVPRSNPDALEAHQRDKIVDLYYAAPGEVLLRATIIGHMLMFFDADWHDILINQTLAQIDKLEDPDTQIQAYTAILPQLPPSERRQEIVAILFKKRLAEYQHTPFFMGDLLRFLTDNQKQQLFDLTMEEPEILRKFAGKLAAVLNPINQGVVVEAAIDQLINDLYAQYPHQDVNQLWSYLNDSQFDRLLKYFRKADAGSIVINAPQPESLLSPEQYRKLITEISDSHRMSIFQLTQYLNKELRDSGTIFQQGIEQQYLEIVTQWDWT